LLPIPALNLKATLAQTTQNQPSSPLIIMKKSPAIIVTGNTLIIGVLLAGKIGSWICGIPNDHHTRGSPSTRFIAVPRQRSTPPGGRMSEFPAESGGLRLCDGFTKRSLVGGRLLG
jgi:hypothetical protein